MRLGADEFLIAPKFTAEVVDAALPERYRPSTEPKEVLMAMGDEHAASARFIGTSPAIYDIRSSVRLVANSPAAVLITGESGTGKEIVARMIHQESDRRDKPFIALNCAALPKDVIENELFGHEKGAFTGALAMKRGVFELADTGTLFFDEIAEMHPEMQAKLLRAIEQKSFRRLGGDEEVTVDVRVLAATNKKIPAAIAAGQFREDLYYRFSVIEIEIPPLRSRCEDIPLLVDHFLGYFAGRYGKDPQKFTDGALSMLMEFEWPGNVRELRNVIERVVVTRNEPVIGVEVLPSRITGQRPPSESVTILLGTSASEADRILTVQTLTWAGENRSKTAEVLGCSRKTLRLKLNKYGIAPKKKPRPIKSGQG
jgi:DNA-binding NtrC family response regulator